MPEPELQNQIEKINKLILTVRYFKEAHPDRRSSFHPASCASIVNAYREGDVSFTECVDLLNAANIRAAVAKADADADAVVASIRWGKVDVRDYNLSPLNRKRIAALLRRLEWLENKDREYAKNNGFVDAEIDATKWAIAFALNSVGKK